MEKEMEREDHAKGTRKHKTKKMGAIEREGGGGGRILAKGKIVPKWHP
jgi:hypothetical protein